jgi:hypothetical protein
MVKQGSVQSVPAPSHLLPPPPAPAPCWTVLRCRKVEVEEERGEIQVGARASSDESTEEEEEEEVAAAAADREVLSSSKSCADLVEADPTPA